ncbi:MAG: polysaccharide deacetylase family protein [Caldicoprobacterales bacterium]|jgi:peptidoglycan/xylan/chitin deacetylase (PgdA/CDA1 family)|nr:polysaccharide deacetylase family protein [Clostridiales bacterium]
MAIKKATFVLSLDTELAWGSFDLGITALDTAQFYNTRTCISNLLQLLEKYRLAATFAFVGHLMLSECSEDNGIKHKEIVRPDFSWYQKDWFTEDPATNLEKDPAWYGADILEEVINAQPIHEIGSHSFSHMIIGADGCSRDSADSDIALSVETAKARGLELKSFVFPRNLEGYRDVLAKYGFRVYRGRGNEWYGIIKNRLLSRACHLLDNLIAISPRTSVPFKDEYGLYNTTGNMLYLSCAGIRKFIPISSRIRKAKKGINRAIKRGEVFHLWFHPFNLASNPRGLLKGLDKIFSYVRDKIDEGVLENCTMLEVCKKYENT